MKKLMLFALVGAFVACGTPAEETPAVETEVEATTPAPVENALDSASAALDSAAVAVDSAAQAVKDAGQ